MYHQWYNMQCGVKQWFIHYQTMPTKLNDKNSCKIKNFKYDLFLYCSFMWSGDQSKVINKNLKIQIYSKNKVFITMIPIYSASETFFAKCITIYSVCFNLHISYLIILWMYFHSISFYIYGYTNRLPGTLMNYALMCKHQTWV